ncbi:MAG: FtsX-like permease family protein, partial [Lawsonibacter sp.]
PVGETITLNGQPFLVVGWYESMDVQYWPEIDNVIVLPYTFNRSMNNNNSFNSYVVKAKSASATVEAMTRLDAFLGGLFPKNEMGYSDKGDYYVQSNNSYADDMKNQSNMQALVLGAIAGISLLVGGIGIMNIMLVTVTERTREIGIRKAIGAERKSIIAQFLIEAAVICSIGGVIGIGIGYVGTLVAGKLLLGDPMMLPTTFITVGAFVFSVVLGVIFGMYPAVKASGLQPVVALRAD